MNTTHPQVPFTTARGRKVCVDEGMFPILAMLRYLGVETQFSCQGDEQAAYVLADSKSFNRLIRRILLRWIFGRYSKESRVTLRRFRSGLIDLQIALYRDRGRDQIAKIGFYSGTEHPQRYAYEYSLENHYGRRVAIRWPTDSGHEILVLLMETIYLASKESL